MKPLRLTFFVLLLANVLFFAWRQNAGPAEGHEPQRLQQQLAPEQLKLILPGKPAPAVAPAAEPVRPEASPPAAAVESKTSAPPPGTPDAAAAKPDKPLATREDSTPALLCKSFSGLSLEAAKSAQSDINTRAPNVKTSLLTVKDTDSYWVHIPPQGSKAGAEKKVSELKQLGIEDSFIISDEGTNRWAVSLGLFRSKDMADSYLQKLTKQGVRSAKIEVRDKGAEKARLEVSAPADALGVLAREIKPLTNATLGDCKTPGAVAGN